MMNGAKWVINTSGIYCTDLTQLLMCTIAYKCLPTVSLVTVAINCNN